MIKINAGGRKRETLCDKIIAVNDLASAFSLSSAERKSQAVVEILYHMSRTLLNKFLRSILQMFING